MNDAVTVANEPTKLSQHVTANTKFS